MLKQIKSICACIFVLCVLASCNKYASVDSIDEWNMSTKMGLSQDYQVFVPTLNSSTSLIIKEIDCPINLNKMRVSCADLYNENTLLLLLYTEDSGLVIHEIGLYNYETKYYSKLCDIELGCAFEICDFSSNYIVLRVSFDGWNTCQLQYLDISSKELFTFYKYSVDTSTDKIFYQNNNNILIDDDIIYFDDYYLDNAGELQVCLYSYDITIKALKLVADNAQNPMGYAGSIVSFRKNAAGKYKDLVSLDERFKYSVSENLINISTTNSTFCCIENKYTDHKNKVTEFQVKDILNNIPIISTTHPIGNLRSGERFIGWTNYDTEIPCVYDTEKGYLILLNDIQAGINNYHFYAEYCLLINTVDDINRLFLLFPK